MWVNNQSQEKISISFKNVSINDKKIYSYYVLDEQNVGEKDYLKMTLYDEELKEICSYKEVQKTEFVIEIGDAETTPLFWSTKIQIMLDVEHEIFGVMLNEI